MAGFTLSYENLRAFCERRKLAFKVNDELRQLAVRFRLLDREAPILVVPLLERGMVRFGMKLPLEAPEPVHARVAEALGWLNSTSYMGCWALNRGRGEVHFRVTVPALDIEYSDEGLELVLRVVAST